MKDNDLNIRIEIRELIEDNFELSEEQKEKLQIMSSNFECNEKNRAEARMKCFPCLIKNLADEAIFEGFGDSIPGDGIGSKSDTNALCKRGLLALASVQRIIIKSALEKMQKCKM